MKKTIIKLLQELFQLDAKVIGESYGGEKFGKGVYYRLVYESDKGEKWEFFLVFEERLIVGTVGSMMGFEDRTIVNTVGKFIGAETDGVDVMMMNATRYTARQFVERIMAHFPAVGKLEVKDENLLTYTQFQRMFERQSPQCSLLFDTGMGYFAYCIAAPHLLKDGRHPSRRKMPWPRSRNISTRRRRRRKRRF